MEPNSNYIYNVKFVILIDGEVKNYSDSEIQAKNYIKEKSKELIEELKKDSNIIVSSNEEDNQIQILEQSLGYIYNSNPTVKHTFTYQKCEKIHSKIPTYSFNKLPKHNDKYTDNDNDNDNDNNYLKKKFFDAFPPFTEANRDGKKKEDKKPQEDSQEDGIKISKIKSNYIQNKNSKDYKYANTYSIKNSNKTNKLNDPYFSQFKKNIIIDKNKFNRVEIVISTEFRNFLEGIIDTNNDDINKIKKTELKFKDIMTIVTQYIKNELKSRKRKDSCNNPMASIIRKQFQLDEKLASLLDEDPNNWFDFFEIWVKLYKAQHYTVIDQPYSFRRNKQ